MFRLVLYGLIIFLIYRLFFSSSKTTKKEPKDDDVKMTGAKHKKRVSKDVGEYVDYEEVDGKE